MKLTVASVLLSILVIMVLASALAVIRNGKGIVNVTVVSVPLSIFLTLLTYVLLLIGNGRGGDAPPPIMLVAYVAAWPAFLFSFITSSDRVFSSPAPFLLDALGWYVALMIGRELMARGMRRI